MCTSEKLSFKISRGCMPPDPPSILAPSPLDIRDLKQPRRERQSTKTADEFLTFRFPFSCLYNSCVSSSFCLKVCDYENLEALFLKQYSNVHVLYKTPESRFSRCVSKDDGGKVARWLHSHVK